MSEIRKALAMVVSHPHTGRGFEILSGDYTGIVFCAPRDTPAAIEVGDTVAVRFCPDDQFARLDRESDADEVICDKRTAEGYICSSIEHGGDDCCDYYNEHGRHATRAELEPCPDHWHCDPSEAAHRCEVDRDRPCPTCGESPAPRELNRYEQKQADRRERYLGRAAKAKTSSARAYQAARSILSVIPMGQPVLVGHHSEKRHRRDLERADSSMRRSIDESNKAAHYAHKADAVGTAGISSDDPDAVVKLNAQLAAVEAAREAEKNANAAIRKAAKVKAKDLGRDLRQADHVALIGALLEGRVITEVIANGLLRMARAFPWLPQFGAHNGAEIRRLKARIAELQQAAAAPDREPMRGRVDGVSYTVEWNKADNRVQIYFPTRPSDAVVEKLKSRGFRWARSVAAWQRHANEQAWYQAGWIVNHEKNGETTPTTEED